MACCDRDWHWRAHPCHRALSCGVFQCTTAAAVDGGNVVRLSSRRHDRRLRRSSAAPVLFRSEEHTSELQSLMRISYAVFCLKKKNTTHTTPNNHTSTRI